MINHIRSQGKIWKRRGKNLVGGEIECPRCGKWTKVAKFTDKHFTQEYICRACNKELNAEKPKVKPKAKPKKKTISMASDCPHKPFFNCKGAKGCQGCYYNPDKKTALLKKNPEDPSKNAKTHWFYGNKVHAKKALKLLDDIKKGKGLFKNGNRFYFKHAKKRLDED